MNREAMGGLFLEESIAAFIAQVPECKHAVISMKHTIGFGSIFINMDFGSSSKLLTSFIQYLLYLRFRYIKIVYIVSHPLSEILFDFVTPIPRINLTRSIHPRLESLKPKGILEPNELGPFNHFFGKVWWNYYNSFPFA